MEILKLSRKPDIVRLWLGQVVSAIGDRFFDLAVVWIATREIGAGAGLVTLAGVIASLAFGILGGVYADRWNRRTTMIITDFVRFGVLMVLFGITWAATLTIWHLAVVMAILSALNALFRPTLYASLPLITDSSQQLQATNALFDVTWRLATAVAPAITGYLLAVLPVGTLFALDGLTFLVSTVALLGVSTKYAWQPELQTERASRQQILDDIRAGARVIWEHPVLRWEFWFSNLFAKAVWASGFIIGVPLFVDEALAGRPDAYGLIVAAYGFGNVAGNLVVGSLDIRRRERVMFGGQVLWGVVFIVFAQTQALWSAMAAVFVMAFGGPMIAIMALVIIQEDMPQNKIGKVYSFRMIINELGLGVGFLAATGLYAVLPVRGAFLVIAAVEIAVGMVCLVKFWPRSVPATERA